MTGRTIPPVSDAEVAASRARWPAAPADWELVSTEGFGPFVTRAEYRRPDGVEVEWTSRRHRKGQGLRLLSAPSTSSSSVAGAVHKTGVPRRTWWIAGLFAVGSLCFALGALPAYFDRVSARVDGATFFVGSIFFTCASFLCFVEAIGSPGSIQHRPVRHLHFRLATWRPRSIDWWATGIQLVGTLYFNVMTFRAVHANWTASDADKLVWRPDVIGSVWNYALSSRFVWGRYG